MPRRCSIHRGHSPILRGRRRSCCRCPAQSAASPSTPVPMWLPTSSPSSHLECQHVNSLVQLSAALKLPASQLAGTQGARDFHSDMSLPGLYWDGSISQVHMFQPPGADQMSESARPSHAPGSTSKHWVSAECRRVAVRVVPGEVGAAAHSLEPVPCGLWGATGTGCAQTAAAQPAAAAWFGPRARGKLPGPAPGKPLPPLHLHQHQFWWRCGCPPGESLLLSLFLLHICLQLLWTRYVCRRPPGEPLLLALFLSQTCFAVVVD